MFRTAIPLLIAILLTVGGLEALAKKKRRRPKKPTRPNPAQIENLLRTGKGPEVERAMKMLASDPLTGLHGEAAMVERVLVVGLPPAAAARVLEGIASMKLKVSTATLRAYARHRRGRVRSAALYALIAVAPKDGKRLAVRALSDRDPLVRRSAARIIGQSKIVEAAPALLKLLRRGDDVVAQPLGAIASPDLARQVSELVGLAPDALVARTLGAMLMNRKFGPDPVRVQVVKALGKVPGSESIEALTSYVSSVPAKPERPSREEAEDIVEKRLSGDGQ